MMPVSISFWRLASDNTSKFLGSTSGAANWKEQVLVPIGMEWKAKARNLIFAPKSLGHGGGRGPNG